MADYLVLEEDGTSHLELEESTDDLYLEEDGPWTNHTVNVDDFVNSGILPDPGIEDSISLVNRTDVNYEVDVDDSVSVADNVSKVQAHTRFPADSVDVSDNFVEKHIWDDYTVDPADSVSVSDVQNIFLNTNADAYQTEDASEAPFELEEGTGFLELEETGGWTDHTVTPADSVALSDSARVDLSPGRFSQAPAEVLVLPTDGEARFSQAAVEVLVLGQDQKARFSQAPAEALVLEVPDARFSQAPTEVVTAPVWNERQAYYDIIRLGYPDAMWRLDEASGNFVDESGTHPFIPSGSVTYQVDGPTGSDWPAMSVTSGGGASQTTFSTAVDNISFEAWFMYSAIGADNQVIFSNVNGSNGWALTINQNGKLQVVVNGTTFLAESTTALAPDTWYQIVVERRNGQWRYYVNGEIDTPNAGTATPGAAVTTMNLFGSADITASMATASYWEQVLTGAEIKEHYNAVFPTTLEYPEFQAHFEGRVIDPLDSDTWIIDDMNSPPLAVIFMGTNFSELDTVVTTTGRGIFRGMISVDPDTGQQIQTATSPIFPGDGQRVSESQAICMGDTNGNIHYSATVTLTETGFECDFDNVGVGTVVAVILKEANNCGMIHGNSGTYDLGFHGRSHIATGWWGAVGNRSDMHGSWFGGGQWQGGALSWEGVGMTAHCYPGSNSGQFGTDMNHIGLSNGMFGQTYAFIGPFMRAANLHCVPPEDTNATTVVTSVDEGPGSFVIWDGMSNCGFLSKPSTAAAATVETVLSSPAFGPAAIITYSIGDIPEGQHSSQDYPPGSYGGGGFGVALADGFRWSCLVEGGALSLPATRAAIQSFSHGWISNINPDGSLHAGDYEFTDTGFITDTTVDSATDQSVLFHAMGLPVVSGWIPHIYRLVMPT